MTKQEVNNYILDVERATKDADVAIAMFVLKLGEYKRHDGGGSWSYINGDYDRVVERIYFDDGPVVVKVLVGPRKNWHAKII
jgi:hypothetical protein